MIELHQTDEDDINFTNRMRKIVLGALLLYKPQEVYVVHIDNWFDWKWLPFSLEELPPFSPNRVLDQQHFTWDATTSAYLPSERGEILHKAQATSEHRNQRRLSKISAPTSFVWYSGNTRKNDAGSLLAYFRIPDGEGSYVAFKRKSDLWEIKRVIGTTEPELLRFEEHGQQQLDAVDVLGSRPNSACRTH